MSRETKIGAACALIASSIGYIRGPASDESRLTWEGSSLNTSLRAIPPFDSSKEFPTAFPGTVNLPRIVFPVSDMAVDLLDKDSRKSKANPALSWFLRTTKEYNTFVDRSSPGDYVAFANTTYATLYDLLKIETEKKSDKPLLVVVLEHHFDPRSETNLEEFNMVGLADQEPAIASTYTYIALLEAASRLYGKQNVLLSLELVESSTHMDESLTLNLDKIRANNNQPRDMFWNSSGEYAMAYALQSDIRIVGSDRREFGTKAACAEQPLLEERNALTLECFQKLATNSSPPKVIIHIAGQSHLEGLCFSPAASRICSESLSGPLIINTARLNPLQRRYEHQQGSDRSIASRLATSDPRVVQIDAPGAFASGEDFEFIERIRDASEKYPAKH